MLHDMFLECCCSENRISYSASKYTGIFLLHSVHTYRYADALITVSRTPTASKLTLWKQDYCYVGCR